MMETPKESERQGQRLEHRVQDAYVISLKQKDEAGLLSADEKHQQFETLVQIVEQLQQQYGIEKLNLTRKFEYVPAVAAIVKDNEILEILLKEGYSVERQGRMKTLLKPDS